jgi:hypothetical protein
LILKRTPREIGCVAVGEFDLNCHPFNTIILSIVHTSDLIEPSSAIRNQDLLSRRSRCWQRNGSIEGFDIAQFGNWFGLTVNCE